MRTARHYAVPAIGRSWTKIQRSAIEQGIERDVATSQTVEDEEGRSRRAVALRRVLARTKADLRSRVRAPAATGARCQDENEGQDQAGLTPLHHGRRVPRGAPCLPSHSAPSDPVAGAGLAIGVACVISI